MIPRQLHRAYARLLGYFWLPCPSCGREFGGHEVVVSSFSVDRVGEQRRTLCPDCTRVKSVRDAISLGYRHGLDIARITDMSSARVYPILARLERDGVIVSGWESGPYPRRRYYRPATEGAPK